MILTFIIWKYNEIEEEEEEEEFTTENNRSTRRSRRKKEGRNLLFLSVFSV